MPVPRNKTDTFARSLLRWFAQHGRHDLPWQVDRRPYRVWISEIMLQQTQVSTVIPYFERFMQRFPAVERLAGAGLDEVLHLWTGLGYYARARHLHKAAQVIMAEYAGRFPETLEATMALPGIGRSTAGAILALSRGQRHAILDGNVKRVLTRLHAIEGWPGRKQVENQLWQLADSYTPDSSLADYTQAIMDLGATICRRGTPRCGACPVSRLCQARQQGAIDRYPSPKPRKILPVRQTRMLLLQDRQGRFLLQQRPPSGIWGGLWCFPESPPDSDIHAWCERHLGLAIGRIRQEPAIRHTFSHFHLDIHPCRASLSAPTFHLMETTPTVWYNTRQPAALGLPGPIKQLLEQLACTI